MLKKILIGICAVIVVLIIVVAMQPAEFRVTRQAVMAAPPADVFAQVNNFHNWEAWSPWAKLDPNAKATYSGAASGKGATLAWAGNSEVGEGSQTILESHPPSHILMKLDFTKPFTATDMAEFTFKPQGEGTQVIWTMYGTNNFMAKAMSLVMDCDKMVGGQFEQGLASLKSVVESAK